MKKRIISILLVFGMVLSAFTGCGKTEDTQSDGMSEKVTLTVGIPQSANVTDYDNNAFTKYLEENLNINIEFSFFSSSASEYMQQLALMCTANEELPDVLIGFHDMGHYNVKRYGQDGYFQDLTDLIDKYGKYYKEQYENLDDNMKEYIQDKGTDPVTGGFYGMPMVCVTLPDDMQNMMYINKEWLKAVNMEAPTNVEELYNVLKAFKEQDPNGNGQADEIPMVSRTNGASYDITCYIINAFVYYDMANPYNATNGKVWSAYTSDEYRQALVYMNKLVKEGLLSDLSFSMNALSDFRALITPADDVARVGIWSGHPSIMSNAKTKILDQYTALHGLGDATGKGGYEVVDPDSAIFNSFITKDCDNTEAAMKLLDFFYKDETLKRARHGEKDVDWKEEEGISELGGEGSVRVINDSAFFNGNSTWCLNGCSIMNIKNYIALKTEGQGRQAEISRLVGETNDFMKAAEKPKEVVHSLSYTFEEYETRDEKSGVHGAYIREQRNLFAVGEKNPNSDADWNEYLKNLEKLGESELLKIAQSAYSRKSK